MKKRKDIFAYNPHELTASVNELIHQYKDNGDDVIYIRHIIQNLPTKRLLFGYSIEGTEGAELFGGLDIVSEYCFDKLLGDALSNKDLCRLITEKGYETLHLCGLDEYGFVVDTAENGQEAVDKIFASMPGDYDLVLMDIQMPVMNGFEATKTIRGIVDKELSSVPIVAMTANAFDEDRKAAAECGMNGFISKPINMEEVIGALHSILSKK